MQLAYVLCFYYKDFLPLNNLAEKFSIKMVINTYNDLFLSLIYIYIYKCLSFIYLLVCLFTRRLSYELQKLFLIQESLWWQISKI